MKPMLAGLAAIVLTTSAALAVGRFADTTAGKVFVNDVPDGLEPREGEFYRCRITEAHDYDLVAQIL